MAPGRRAGCGCVVVDAGGAAGGGLAALALVALGAWRRRRRG
jgi:MYXO-CTERM domain-containing protein